MRYKLLLPIVLFFGLAHAQDKKIDEATGLIIDDGFELVSAQCTVCHNANLIISNLQDRNTWTETIRWMQKTQNLWPLGDDEPLILDYLAKNYGIEGLEPPRRKNLPVALLGKPEAEKGVITVATDSKTEVKTETVVAASGPEATYKKVCFACHDRGVAGAPKLGDKTAWAPRIALGKDTLTQSVLQGKGAMPPKGGMSSITDAEAAEVVEYMINQAQ